MTNLATIAARDSRSIEDIRLILERWCAPVVWAMPTAIDKALANDPTWRQWIDYDHPWLAEAGYYDSATTPEQRVRIADQFREARR